MRVLSILARHGTAKYATAVADVQEYHRRRLPHARCELVVVDNAPGAAPGPVEGATVVAGSNRAWEFSAWDEGLAHVGARVWEYDLVHLVTSAFRTLYTRYIDRLDERALGLVAGRGVAVGHVDSYGETVELLGVRARHWLRSSFVFVPPAELALLGTCVGVADPSPFFSEDPAAPFLADAPLSATYRRYIVDWLTGEGTGQGTEWHSRFALSAETLPFFRAKALAILNEQRLAIRLRRQGCAIVDATWLATWAARNPAATELGAIPEWRDQLAERDTDAQRVARATL